MGLSIIYRYGLRGVSKDASEADLYWLRATSPRGTRAIRAGGHTTYVPRYGITPSSANFNERCAEGLAEGRETPEVVAACGGKALFDQLAALWRAG